MTVVDCHPEHDSVHNGGEEVCVGSYNSVTCIMTTGLCNLIEFVSIVLRKLVIAKNVFKQPKSIPATFVLHQHHVTQQIEWQNFTWVR